jgi:DNA-binding transcriptional ArsR family regulator
MTEKQEILSILANLGIPQELTEEILEYFTRIAEEIRTLDLEKSSIGKFVETVVQILQTLDSTSHSYDKTVRDVEKELLRFESNSIRNLNDESRIAIVRITRAMQCLRNKRGIIHKNLIDPNLYDLEFIYHCAQWIVTEFIRLGSKTSFDVAKSIVENIQKPICPIITKILGKTVILSDSISLNDELILVLYSEAGYDKPLKRNTIGKILDRRPQSSISVSLSRLYGAKIIEGSSEEGYVLTPIGYKKANEIIKSLKG